MEFVRLYDGFSMGYLGFGGIIISFFLFIFIAGFESLYGLFEGILKKDKIKIKKHLLSFIILPIFLSSFFSFGIYDNLNNLALENKFYYVQIGDREKKRISRKEYLEIKKEKIKKSNIKIEEAEKKVNEILK